MRSVQEGEQRLTERQEPFVVAVPEARAARLVEHTTGALVLGCEPVKRGPRWMGRVHKAAVSAGTANVRRPWGPTVRIPSLIRRSRACSRDRASADGGMANASSMCTSAWSSTRAVTIAALMG